MKMPKLRVKRIAYKDPLFGAAKKAEFHLFGEANRFVSLDDVAAGEMLVYREYDEASEFYVAYDSRNESMGPVGVIRSIRFDPRRGCESFSTLRDGRYYSHGGSQPKCYIDEAWNSYFEGQHLSHISEIASQAILPSYRRPWAIEHIWDAMMDVSEREGVIMWIMAPIVPLFRSYKRSFPNAFQTIGQMMPQYVGADSVPAIVRLDHPEIQEYKRRFRRVRANLESRPCYRVGVTAP